MSAKASSPLPCPLSSRWRRARGRIARPPSRLGLAAARPAPGCRGRSLDLSHDRHCRTHPTGRLPEDHAGRERLRPASLARSPGGPRRSDRCRPAGPRGRPEPARPLPADGGRPRRPQGGRGPGTPARGPRARGVAAGERRILRARSRRPDRGPDRGRAGRGPGGVHGGGGDVASPRRKARLPAPHPQAAFRGRSHGVPDDAAARHERQGHRGLRLAHPPPADGRDPERVEAGRERRDLRRGRRRPHAHRIPLHGGCREAGPAARRGRGANDGRSRGPRSRDRARPRGGAEDTAEDLAPDLGGGRRGGRTLRVEHGRLPRLPRRPGGGGLAVASGLGHRGRDRDRP